MRFAIFKSIHGRAGREQVGEEATERAADKRVKHLRDIATATCRMGNTVSVYYWYERQ